MARLFLSSASNGLHPHDYDVSSVCSLDFGDLLPIINVDSVPTDDWQKFEGKAALRLQAQVFPTFGKAFIKSAAFFVPEHQIYEDADAFHENESSYKGKAVVQPHFSSIAFVDLLIRRVGCVTLVHQAQNPVTGGPSNPDSFDFVYPVMENNVLTYNYYKLTRYGERHYKIYKMLGYDFPSFVYDSTITTASAVRAYGNFIIPAVSLLSYVKVYCDMFLSGTNYNFNEQVALLHSIRNKESVIDGSDIYYDATTGEITALGLSRLFNILVPHESSMYTQAWNNLNSPSGVNTGGLLKSEMPSGLVSPVSGLQNANSPSLTASSAFANYLVANSGSSLTNITQSGLRFLQAFDRFVRRWNLSGTKAVQKVYAQFGIKSDDFNSHFVHKLYEGSNRIDFSPVLSNADTESGGIGKRIGDYAGFGVGGLNVNFNYKSSDYGQIVVVAWLQIVPMLTRGFDPMNLKRFPQDYYTPEFDGKAYRAIPQCEVSVNKGATDDPVSEGVSDGAVYGFTNVYDEYRNLRDRIGGAFVTDAVAKNFLLSRDLSVIRALRTIRLMPQSNEVHYWDTEDNADVTNPFQNAYSNGDRFYLYVDWNIRANRPMLSDSESFDIGTGDIQVEKNGDMMS